MIKPDINNINDFAQIALLIEESRNRAFQKVNEELVLLYFKVGLFVSEKVTAGAWGEGTVDELAKYIAERLPGLAGFNRRGIYRMKQFYETYCQSSDCFLLWVQSKAPIVSPLATQLLTHEDDTGKVSPVATQIQDINYQHNKFVSAVLTQISWTNHLEIFSAIKKSEQRLFYLLMSVKEKWSKLELRRQIQSAFFERTMMGNNIHSLLQPHLPENLFKDPYIFEFLDLPDVHSEKDLEKALILNLQKFILEIGKGFTYMGNQYRIQVGKKDYYTDLLFFNRDLQCLVMFELKISEFEPEFLGKLNFYLEALDRDVKRPHEKPSIGVLLCKGKDSEVVEYAMARNTSPALIADYETKLIPKSILANKLHQLAEQLSKGKH
ncbi:MAG: PDDEXK nuclease domain-containing protein [Bacteroidota bacterium]|nr:PDDEXK nuclease domain-containing protein [Bacteroidota bacterium]